MANNIKIKIDTSQYRPPSQDDIKSAKQFILRRDNYAQIQDDIIDEYLENAAKEIVTICYKYNIGPNSFVISSQYNEEMMTEIAEVMDTLEADIMSTIYDYSLRVTDNESHRNMLAAWIVSLGRGNRNFQDTLDGYLYKTMKDWEAAIAALRSSGASMADAITQIKTYMHSIYTMPEVLAAFKNAKDFAATYIRTRGVDKGAVGLSNNGSTNVTNMARTTLQMAWMREQGTEFEEEGAEGYYQLRGSSYPCTICDDEVGFHKGLDDIYMKPYPHPHCCCYRVPVFKKESPLAESRREIKELAQPLTEEVFINEDFDKDIHISKSGIKEWLNQPHKHYEEKNRLLLSMKDVIRDSKYRSWLPDEHNASIKAHLFETTIRGDKSWIIVREFQDGKVLLHSITDSDAILKALERYRKSAQP